MIDEKKLIENLIPLLNEHGDMYFAGRIIGMIDSQPKIGKWIPCSERLPKKGGVYICTQYVHNLSNGEITGRTVEAVGFYGGKWARAKHLKVIAWQPLPEPYHEQTK